MLGRIKEANRVESEKRAKEKTVFMVGRYVAYDGLSSGSIQLFSDREQAERYAKKKNNQLGEYTSDRWKVSEHKIDNWNEVLS